MKQILSKANTTMHQRNSASSRLFWHRSVFLLMLCGILSAPFEPLRATVTKVAGMGLDNNTVWMVDKQLSFIYENPAAIHGWGNHIFFEYFNTQQFGGIFIPLPRGITLGIFSGTEANNQVFNTTDFQSMYHTSGTDPAGIVFFPLPTASSGAARPADIAALGDDLDDPAKNNLASRNLEVMLSYPLTSRITAGFGLSYAFASNNVKQDNIPSSGAATTSDEISLWKSEFRLSAGILYDLGFIFRTISASVFFQKYSLDNFYKRTVTNASISDEIALRSNGAFDMGIATKGTIFFSEKAKLNVRLAYSILDRSTKATQQGFQGNTNLESTYDRNGHKIELGASNEIQLSKKLMLFWGSQFVYEPISNSYEAVKFATTNNTLRPYKTSVYSLTVPLILGMSADIADDWDIRFGVRHNILNSPNNSEQTAETKNNAGAVTQSTVTSRSAFLSTGSSISMGVSYQISSISFDWLTNVAIFKDGPYFISGKPNSWSTAFSVTFNFGELLSSGGVRKQKLTKPK